MLFSGSDGRLSKFASWFLVRKCRRFLATFYKRQVDDRAWPPVKTTNFINLALVKDQTSWRKTVQDSVDEILSEKESTSYEGIFDGIKDLDHNFILLEGRPGSGKTTLMNKISRDWANGKILTSELVIFVPFRRLSNEPDRNLATILRVACPTLPQSNVNKLMSHIENHQGKAIVFAFDGLDEYVPLSDNDSVLELLCGRSLTKALVIVTSRPVACTEFRQFAAKRIEVLGFLKSQIIDYIHHYFYSDRLKAQELEAHLKQHPNLMNMAYLPLHCAMLAFLYEEDTVLPETETEFYKHFTLSTLLRSIRKRQGGMIKMIAFDQLPRGDKVIFDKVCKLAFNATVESKQVFTSNDVKTILIDADDTNSDVSSLGLVVVDRYFMRYGLDETYTFLHLTFQEYLAAVHIASLSESQQRDIIKANHDKRHLSVVWRFLCGMMDFNSASSMDNFKCLIGANEHKLFQVQCCYESQHSLPCTCVISAFCGHVEFNGNNLSPSDCVAIGYTIKNSVYHQTVNLSFVECNFSFEGIVAFLEVSNRGFSLTLK